MKRIHVPQFRAQLMTAHMQPTAAHSTWYTIKNSADAAEVLVYDEIGFYGVSSAQFAAEVGALDVPRITVRINSPGGDVFAGVAIYNALVDHPAHITTEVDGLAASAASVVLQAGDVRIVKPGTQVMVHDAWGLAMGNEADMIEFGGVLGGLSDSIADVYADRAGNTPEAWRKTMRSEQWYSADEAVAAGLADSVKTRKKADADDEAPQNRWALSIFNYSGRDNAPAPVLPVPAPPQAGPTEPFDVDGLRNALMGAFQ